MYEEKNEKTQLVMLWTNLLLQVLPLRNHHIVILALFPKFHIIELTGSVGGGMMETWFNACDSDQWIF